MRTAREFALSLPFFVPQLTPIRCRSVLRLPHEAPFPDSGTTQHETGVRVAGLAWRDPCSASPGPNPDNALSADDQHRPCRMGQDLHRLAPEEHGRNAASAV